MLTNKTFDEIQIGDSATIDRTLTKKDVVSFAQITGDMNPTHLSDEFAKTLLKNHKITGHAMWGGSLISSLLGNKIPGPGTVYKAQDLHFHKAVELGDTLSVTIKVEEKFPENNNVIFNCSAVNQNGVQIITGTAQVLAPVEKVTVPGLAISDIEESDINVFEKFIDKCARIEPIKVAVCHPCDKHSLLGPVKAAERSLIEPILVGPEEKIKSVAEESEIDISPYEIVKTRHSEWSAEKSVELCRIGEAEALMKGSLHTDELLSKVAIRETGLRTGRRFSHVFVMNVKTYPRPLYITDSAINIYPTLSDKVDIISNAIELAHALGTKEPKVAILSAVETVNPKISSTIEAAALCKMADRGQITGGILDGPLAFDNAVSEEAARIKGIKSLVAGRADILMVPDLESGNMLAKQLTYLANAEAAGIVLGARVPIILTSRADSDKARLASCAVAVALAKWRKSGKKAGVTC